MTHSLQRLTYRSQAAPAARGLEAQSRILEISQNNNVRDHLTGALTYCDGWFIQVIEGPAESLDGLLARLDRDDRHTGIEIAERVPVSTRLFPDWCMASVHLEPSLQPVVADILLNWDSAAHATANALLAGLDLQSPS